MNMEYDFTGMFSALLRWISVALVRLSTSVSQTPGALAVWALARKGGRMIEASFLEDLVLKSGLEAG